MGSKLKVCDFDYAIYTFFAFLEIPESRQGI